jgi:hypothetical protein
MAPYCSVAEAGRNAGEDSHAGAAQSSGVPKQLKLARYRLRWPKRLDSCGRRVAVREPAAPTLRALGRDGDALVEGGGEAYLCIIVAGGAQAQRPALQRI